MTAWCVLLATAALAIVVPWVIPAAIRSAASGAASALLGLAGCWVGVQALVGTGAGVAVPMALPDEIGRASCRERVCWIV